MDQNNQAPNDPDKDATAMEHPADSRESAQHNDPSGNAGRDAFGNASDFGIQRDAADPDSKQPPE